MTARTLRRWRIHHGLTQKALAELLGVSTDHVRDMENGRTRIKRVLELALKALEKQGWRP